MSIKKFTKILLALISTSAIAQNEIRFGAKAGVNLTGFHTGKSAFTGNVLFTIGGLAELELSDSFSLQAELLYNKKGGTIKHRNESIFAYDIKTKLDYLDLPIIVKYEFVRNMSFDFGPQIGFLINSKGKIENSLNDNGDEVELNNTNTIDFSLNGGLSFNFNENIFLQARYSYGFSEIFDDERYKNSVVSLSLGYFFK